MGMDKDIAALRDAYFWVPVGEPDHTAARIHRILDALEEAREVIEMDEECRHKCPGCTERARAFLAKYGEGSDG